MDNLLTRAREIEEALSHIKFGLDFAYEQGLHEFGYDPVEVIRAALAAQPLQVSSDEEKR